MVTFLGRALRVTEAIHDSHLFDDGQVLWLGSNALMKNVVRAAAQDDDRRILNILVDKMAQSVVQRRSIPWR